LAWGYLLEAFCSLITKSKEEGAQAATPRFSILNATIIKIALAGQRHRSRAECPSAVSKLRVTAHEIPAIPSVKEQKSVVNAETSNFFRKPLKQSFHFDEGRKPP
jgi:hypothetical protein